MTKLKRPTQDDFEALKLRILGEIMDSQAQFVVYSTIKINKEGEFDIIELHIKASGK